jgi:hypothetical protein
MIAALVRWLLIAPSRVLGRPGVGLPRSPSPEDDLGAGI